VTTPHTQFQHEAFRVEVRHSYFFDGGASAPVVWLPVEQTAARLAAQGLVLRNDKGTLSVMRTTGANRDTPADLLFQLTTTDPWFVTYTELGTTGPDATLWFDTTMASAANSGDVRRLHQGATVSAADRVAREALPLQHWITQHTPHAAVGFLNIRYSPADPPGMAWTIAFAARAVVWQYQVRGASGRAVFIRDADGQVGFEPAASAPLPGDAGAMAVRSTEAVALQDTSPRRFQLMETTPQGERVLINRLAVASPHALRQETVEGRVNTVAVVEVHL